MTEEVELTVVLPAYLEEENLRLLLPRLRATLDALALSWEVLVVDTMTPMDLTRPNSSRTSGRTARKTLS